MTTNNEPDTHTKVLATVSKKTQEGIDLEVLDDLLNEKLAQGAKHMRTPTEFSIYIETQVQAKGSTILDALLEYMEEYDVEPEAISSKLTKSLKSKLSAEAQKANFLRGGAQVAELPF